MDDGVKAGILKMKAGLIFTVLQRRPHLASGSVKTIERALDRIRQVLQDEQILQLASV